MADALACRAHEHGQARRCATSALNVHVTVDITRNARVVVSQAAELLEHNEQGLGVVVWLGEAHSRLARTQRVVGDLPNLPWVNLGDVLVGRDALQVDFDLWPGGDAHVVDQRTSGSVTDVLHVLDGLGDAATPQRAGGFDERSLGVGLLTQWVVVQHGLDDVVPHEPDVGVVLTGRIRDIFLVQTPVDEHLTTNFTPEFEGIIGRSGPHIARKLVLKLIFLQFYVLYEPCCTGAIAQNCTDSILVIARNTDQIGQIHAG